MFKTILLASLMILCLRTISSASYKDALDLYENGKYADSLKLIAAELDTKKDMEKDSPNYDLRFLAAHNHWKLGNSDSAILHFRKCMEIRKDSPDPIIDLSFLLIDKKRYGDAIFFAQQALAKGESPAVYLALGKSCYFAGRFSQAKTYLEKAISLNPEFVEAYNSMGMLLARMGKFSEAGTAFSAAHALFPGNAEIINNLAINYENQGDVKTAFDYISKASELDPQNKLIIDNLNRLKAKAGVK